MAETTSRKRKRIEDDEDLATEDQRTAKIVVTNDVSTAIGPAFATFSGLNRPTDSGFDCYLLEEQPSTEFCSSRSLLFGESTTMDFSSINQDKVERGYDCQYVIAVRDKSKNRMYVRSAPLYLVGQRVKALEKLQSIGDGNKEYSIARNQLGEAFGTKKAKAAIRAAERNRVNGDAMQDVAGIIQDTIGSKTMALPSVENLKSETDKVRPIPRLNTEATSPSEVYPVDSVISQGENATILIKTLSISTLPYKKSVWINTHVQRCAQKSSKADKADMKILYYLSCMLLFRRLISRSSERVDIREKMSVVPEIIVDSLISRFTETSRKGSTIQTTPAKETELLTHFLAMCLRIDNYATDYTIIAADLGMATTSVQQLFKALGCVIGYPSSAERSNLGITNEQAKEKKFAILRVPLTFPSSSRRHR